MFLVVIVIEVIGLFVIFNCLIQKFIIYIFIVVVNIIISFLILHLLNFIAWLNIIKLDFDINLTI